MFKVAFHLHLSFTFNVLFIFFCLVTTHHKKKKMFRSVFVCLRVQILKSSLWKLDPNRGWEASMVVMWWWCGVLEIFWALLENSDEFVRKFRVHLGFLSLYGVRFWSFDLCLLVLTASARAVFEFFNFGTSAHCSLYSRMIVNSGKRVFIFFWNFARNLKKKKFGHQARIPLYRTKYGHFFTFSTI